MYLVGSFAHYTSRDFRLQTLNLNIKGLYQYPEMLRLALCVLFVYVSHVSALEDLSSVWNHGHHDQEVLGDNGSERGGASIGKTIMVPLQRKVLQSYGHYYFLNLSIGSPGQQLELFIDTGSSDTWVYDNSYCNGSTDYHYQCCESEPHSPSGFTLLE